jgi:hypothetical protein
MASGGVKKLPPANTRSGSSATTFSMSTPSKVATSGMSPASGGYRKKSWPLPTTRSPRPRANNVSVVAGVSETITSGSASISMVVPSSSVRVTGKAAALGEAVGEAVGAGEAVVREAAGVAIVVTGGLDDAPPPVQPATKSIVARTRASRRIGGF